MASDLFQWNGGSYVVVVDYYMYSRYWEIAVIHSTTSTAVINKLRQIFAASHGIPETVKSDNGPQYGSAEFDTFAANWTEFSHVTLSQKYPQSNGFAEKTVKTAKRILEKAKRDQRVHTSLCQNNAIHPWQATNHLHNYPWEDICVHFYDAQ